MRAYPAALLTDGLVHAFRPTVMRPNALCGTVLNKTEDFDPRPPAVAVLEDITCEACRALIVERP